MHVNIFYHNNSVVHDYISYFSKSTHVWFRTNCKTKLTSVSWVQAEGMKALENKGKAEMIQYSVNNLHSSLGLTVCKDIMALSALLVACARNPPLLVLWKFICFANKYAMQNSRLVGEMGRHKVDITLL